MGGVGRPDPAPELRCQSAVGWLFELIWAVQTEHFEVHYFPLSAVPLPPPPPPPLPARLSCSRSEPARLVVPSEVYNEAAASGGAIPEGSGRRIEDEGNSAAWARRW